MTFVASTKKVFRFIWIFKKEGIKAVFYLLAVIALWVLAVWDAANVISNYLNDNSATLVRSVEIQSDGGAEFAEDVIVCVKYNNSLFEHLWWNDSKVKKEVYDAYEAADNWNLTRKVFESINFNSTSTLSLTKRQYIHAVKIIKFFVDGDMYNRANSFGWPISIEPFDEFWTDDQFDKLSDSVRKLFDEASAKSPHLSFRSSKKDEICYNIRVENVLIPMNAPVVKPLVPFGLTNENELAAEENFKTNRPTAVTIIFPRTNEYTPFDWEPQRFLTISVLIATRGVFDRHFSNKCFGDRVPEYRKTCRDYYYLQLVKQNCKCTPFMYKDFDDKQRLSYCTRKNYENCSEKIIDKLSSYTCEQCLQTQNSYPIVYNWGESDSPNRTNNDLHIYFKAVDTFYARFEEKLITTWYQTMAQVGGDIGFYTGFSLWALWKFFMFISSTYRSRRQPQKKISITKDQLRSDAQESWFRVAYNYWREGDNQFKRQQWEKENEERLKERLKRLEEAYMSLVADRQKERKTSVPESMTIVNMP